MGRNTAKRAEVITVNRRRWLRLAALLSIVGALALPIGPSSTVLARRACDARSSTTEWATFGRDLANTRHAEDATTPGATGSLTLSPVWAFTTSGASAGLSDLNGTPIVAGGCVYLNTAGGEVIAIDAANGSEIWRATVALTPGTVAGLGGIFVSSPVVHGSLLVALVNEQGMAEDPSGAAPPTGPYAIAFDRHTGAMAWRSERLATGAGYYTNATPVVANGIVLAGISPAEGDPTGRGGVALIDVRTGRVLRRAWTVPDEDYARGYAGGGIWTAPAVDLVGKYAYAGTGNPFSKTVEHPNTNAIVKIDIDRHRRTFGSIVGAAKGNIDQYAPVFRDLVDPVCDAVGEDPNLQLVVGNSAPCLQLDLDFGAPPNLFTDSSGRLLIGDLQKSGVYHVADATTMEKEWSATVGASCPACNAAASAWDGQNLYGVSTPGGAMYSLTPEGGLRWMSPVADGVHYQSTTVANGVVYTIDSAGFLLGFEAATGAPILRRPVFVDLPPGSVPPVAVSSSGIAVVGDTVYVAAGNAVIAYRALALP